MRKKAINILVIEHNLINRRLFIYLLHDMGFHNTTEISKSTAGWDLIQNHMFDIIFCDFSMPDINGIDLLKRVRCNPTCKNIPFLIITATNKKSLIVNAIDSGVTALILKPFDANFIEKKINKILHFGNLDEMTYAC